MSSYPLADDGSVKGGVASAEPAGGPSAVRFAFAGRVSTEDLQSPTESRCWQVERAVGLVAGHGEIVAEFFDVGQSRATSWLRRSQSCRLLKALADPGRGFDAVLVGEPQRVFYDNQYGMVAPLFAHYRVPLWVPELGGPVDTNQRGAQNSDISGQKVSEGGFLYNAEKCSSILRRCSPRKRWETRPDRFRCSPYVGS